jgi:RHS repeat-associated protein
VVDCSLRFQNQWEDKESGLYYNLNRYYDPESGQYLSQDPIGLAGGLRTHGYVHDPMQWVDPWGLAACWDAKANRWRDPASGRFARSLKGPRTVYRQGTFADESVGWEGNYVKGKQWASDNPLTTPDYAKKYGLPSENTGRPDWVVKGQVKGAYTTRPAPASYNNPANTGGGPEVIPNSPNAVRLDWFHMPDS